MDATMAEDQKSLLLIFLGNSPELRIIDFFLDNKLFDFSKKEIIEGTGLSKATFYGHWDRLERFGLVTVARKFGKAKLYRLSRDTPVVQRLVELEKQLIRLAAEKQIGTQVEA